MNQRGFALVTVLWALVLLGGIALVFGAGIRQSAMTVHNLGDRAELAAATDAGFALALERLLTANTAEIETEGTWFCRFNDTDLAMTIVDEAARLDLNALSESLAAALLEEIGLSADDSRDIAARILDYRDADDELRTGGAEAAAYQQAGSPFRPKNEAFDTVEELGRVLEMTPAVIDLLRPVLTVHKRQPGIDPEIASPTAAAAMKRMMDRPVEAALTDTEASQLYFRALYLPSVRSTFRIRVDARLAGGAEYARETIVLMTAEDRRGYRLLARQDVTSAATGWQGSIETCSVDQTADWIRSRQPDLLAAGG